MGFHGNQLKFVGRSYQMLCFETLKNYIMGQNSALSHSV